MSNYNHNDLPRNVEPEMLTAYALGQLQGDELAQVEALLAAGDEAAQREIGAVRALVGFVSDAKAAEPMLALASDLRHQIQEKLVGGSVQSPVSKVQSREGEALAEPVTIAASKKPWFSRVHVVEWIAVAGLALLFMALLLPVSNFAIRTSTNEQAALATLMASPSDTANTESSQDDGFRPLRAEQRYSAADEQVAPETAALAGTDPGMTYSGRFQRSIHENETIWERSGAKQQAPGGYQRMMSARDKLPPGDLEAAAAQGRNNAEIEVAESAIKGPRGDLHANEAIRTQGAVPRPEVSEYGFQLNEAERLAPRSDPGRVLGPVATLPAAEYRDDLYPAVSDGELAKLRAQSSDRAALAAEKRRAVLEFDSATATTIETMRPRSKLREGPGTEQYAPIIENRFLSPLQQPLSTFSIDVDTASYANVRRFLNEGRLPPANSVRIEELVNYFRYDYPQPKGEQPFSVNMEVAECPWALTPALSQGEREGKRGHLLLRVGLKGKDVHRSERPASNLVFLLDVSGSMADQNKLPLLKTAMKLLVGELGENDRVSIVTYAGEAGLKLAPTRGHEQQKINRVIDGLSAGGSTNGSAGIDLAYEQAAKYFVQGGANRVILCTDGDLNVGITSDEALVKLIKKKAASGVFLTVLGFGEGNLKDAKMERLADNGNGLYAYIDSVREAKKVLVEQLTGSTITIAKDVKIQIEFNPAQIAAYRLLGYENRVMAAQDFNNDKKDAGDIGAGHTVTALYELVPAGAVDEEKPRPAGVDPLKYQQPGANLLPEKRVGDGARGAPGPGLVPAKEAETSGELLTVKLRYKEPDGQTSKLIEYPLKDRGHSFHSASPDLQFAAAVASFGMILRGSEHRGSSNLAAVAEVASAALGKDESGYRAEFVDLVRKAQALGAR